MRRRRAVLRSEALAVLTKLYDLQYYPPGKRISTALEWIDRLVSALEEADRERDEARAEVARLRVELGAEEAERERDEARAALVAARAALATALRKGGHPWTCAAVTTKIPCDCWKANARRLLE